MFYFEFSPPFWRVDVILEPSMEHDLRLRAAARAIYDACYPSEDWAPVGFSEAERLRTLHYRQAVCAAQQARAVLADFAEQAELFPPRLGRGVA